MTVKGTIGVKLISRSGPEIFQRSMRPDPSRLGLKKMISEQHVTLHLTYWLQWISHHTDKIQLVLQLKAPFPTFYRLPWLLVLLLLQLSPLLQLLFHCLFGTRSQSNSWWTYIPYGKVAASYKTLKDELSRSVMSTADTKSLFIVKMDASDITIIAVLK